jgi:TPR repeat protein
LKAAVDQCDGYGELYYGICLLDGNVVERDAAMAVEYFRRSANQENAMGQVNVGFCYHKGLGVARNPLRSVEYFKAAADQENAVGQFNYALGERTVRHRLRSFAPFSLAIGRISARVNGLLCLKNRKVIATVWAI